MALIVSSEHTFCIPATVTQGDPLGVPVSMKRISADGVFPVVIEGTNINLKEIVVHRYLSYSDGITRQNRRIDKIELQNSGKYWITIQNPVPVSVHWDAFPTSDETDVQWVEADNYRVKDDYTSDFYYFIENRNIENLVFDIEFERAGAEDLMMEMATFKRPITKEEIRVGNIFKDENYIDDAKDVDTIITQKIYTLKPVVGDSFKYRIPMDLLLTDQLVRIRLYPSVDEDSTIKIDVHVNSLGYRWDVSRIKET